MWSGAWVGLVSSSPLQSLKAVKGQQRHEAAVHAQGPMRMQIELCVDKASRTYDSAFLPIAAAVEIIARSNRNHLKPPPISRNGRHGERDFPLRKRAEGTQKAAPSEKKIATVP